MRQIYYWIKIIFLSLKWIPNINLGDIVLYEGKRWCVMQGVMAPTWEIQVVDSFERKSVHESLFKKEATVKNYFGSFKSAYQFYMTSWYRIWCYSGIQPWMKACRIWGNRIK